MTSAWAHFATYGYPALPDSGHYWAPVYPNEPLELQFWNIFGPNPSMQTSGKLMERMRLWDQVMGGGY